MRRSLSTQSPRLGRLHRSCRSVCRLGHNPSLRGGSVERDPNDLATADTHGAGGDVRRPFAEATPYGADSPPATVSCSLPPGDLHQRADRTSQQAVSRDSTAYSDPSGAKARSVRLVSPEAYTVGSGPERHARVGVTLLEREAGQLADVVGAVWPLDHRGRHGIGGDLGARRQAEEGRSQRATGGSTAIVVNVPLCDARTTALPPASATR